MTRNLSLRLLLGLLLCAGCSRTVPPADLLVGEPEYPLDTTGRFTYVTAHDIEAINVFMIFPYESYIVMFGRFHGGFVQVVDKESGAIVCSGIPHGRGPGELVGAEFADLNPQTGTMTIVDGDTHQILSFNIDDFIAGRFKAARKPAEPFACQVFELDREHTLCDHLVTYTSTVYGVPDRLSVLRKDGTKTAVYNEFPIMDTVRNYNFIIYQQRRASLSPDRTKLAMGTITRRTFFETFDIGKTRIVPRSQQLHSGPADYSIRLPFEKWTGGFLSVYAGDELVVAATDDFTEKPDRKIYNNLCVFDWDGHPIKRIRMEGCKCIEALCLDSDGRTVYAVMQDDNGFYYFARTEI